MADAAQNFITILQKQLNLQQFRSSSPLRQSRFPSQRMENLIH